MKTTDARRAALRPALFLLVFTTLVIAPIVGAQFTRVTEDFDDDTLGNTVDGSSPNEDWYTYFRGGISGNACPAANMQISTTNAISGRSHRLLTTTTTEACEARLRFTDTSLLPIRTSYRMKLNLGAGDGQFMTGFMTVFDSNGNSMGVQWAFISNSGGHLCMSASVSSSNCITNSFDSSVGLTSTIDWLITFNTVTSSATVTNEATGASASITFPNAPIRVAEIRLIGDNRFSPAPAVREVIVDNVVIDFQSQGAPDSPIGQAKSAFAKGWGISETATGWLFAMFVIGAAVMSAGRNPIAVGVMAVVGVFVSFFLGFVPVWFGLLIIFIAVALAGNRIFGGRADED